MPSPWESSWPRKSAVERRALQRVAVGHGVVLPLLVELFEGQLVMRLERIDDPDVLAEYLSWFHIVGKDNDFFLIHQINHTKISE